MAVKHYIYESGSGRLVSIGSAAPGKLKPGLTVKVIDDDQADTKIWDEVTESLVNRPGRRVISTEELFQRFTELELQHLLGKSEQGTHEHLRALSRFVRLTPRINLDGPIIQDGLAELVRKGEMTTQRRAEILRDG